MSGPARRSSYASVGRRALARGLSVVLGGAAAVLAGPLVVVPEARPAPAPAAVVGSQRVAQLVRQHQCWTGAAPDPAVEPGHAVVTRADGKVRYVDARRGFAIWLEGSPGTLHAFCP